MIVIRNVFVLINATKRTLEELHNSMNVKSLQPLLLSALALSFYQQGFKLIYKAYHIIQEKNVSIFNGFQAACIITGINSILLLLTSGMQTVQQLKDKVYIFNQYEDCLKLSNLTHVLSNVLHFLQFSYITQLLPNLMIIVL